MEPGNSESPHERIVVHQDGPTVIGGGQIPAGHGQAVDRDRRVANCDVEAEDAIGRRRDGGPIDRDAGPVDREALVFQRVGDVPRLEEGRQRRAEHIETFEHRALRQPDQENLLENVGNRRRRAAPPPTPRARPLARSCPRRAGPAIRRRGWR